MLSMTNLGLMASSASPSATVNDRNSNYNNGVGVRPLTASASIATNLILMAKHHQQHHLNHFHQQRHSNSALMSLSSNTITSIPPSPSISLNSASSSLIPIKDFAPSSMVSSVSSAWDTWEDVRTFA